MNQVESIVVNSPIGDLKISGTQEHIHSIQFLKNETTQPHSHYDILRICAQQLDAYFHHKRQTFQLPMSFQTGTDFQHNVWQKLCNIPFGKTISYLKFSKDIGNEKAIRAIASANGKNPLPILIPCHRVIGSDGSLTGYAGGLGIKKWLLNHEQNQEQLQLF